MKFHLKYNKGWFYHFGIRNKSNIFQVKHSYRKLQHQGSVFEQKLKLKLSPPAKGLQNKRACIVKFVLLIVLIFFVKLIKQVAK